MIDLIASRFQKDLSGVSFGDWNLFVTREYLQWTWRGRCADSGGIARFHGRKWRLSPHMTKSELVQTALKAALTAVEHEARERFLYRGQPIFGPHFDVDSLVEICEAGATDERQAAR